MKMPGIYAAYALIMASSAKARGHSPGFHAGQFGAIVLLYFVGRRFLDRAGAVAASAAYALLSLSPSVQGFNAHATHFVVLAALGAILVLLRAQERGAWRGFFWSGALFGVAFLMKQPGGAFAFFGFSLILLWAAWRRQPPDWKRTDCAWRFTRRGGGADSVDRIDSVAGRRVGQILVVDGDLRARSRHALYPGIPGRIRLAGFLSPRIWVGTGLFWALALAGLAACADGKGRADEKFFFLSLLFFSAAAVCPTFHFTIPLFCADAAGGRAPGGQGLRLGRGVAGGPAPGAGARGAVDSLWPCLGRRRLVPSRLVFFVGPAGGSAKMYPPMTSRSIPLSRITSAPFAAERPLWRCSVRNRSCSFTRIGARSRATFTCTTWWKINPFASAWKRK
jgi:hypothetical protein